VPPLEEHLVVTVEALFAVTDDLERAGRQTRGGTSLLSLLRIISDHQGIRPAVIAERQAVHSSVVTRRIRECEAAGFVRVSPDPTDRRSVQVSLEPAGSAELSRRVALEATRLAGVVHDWEPDEVRSLSELLVKLRASLSATGARDRLPRRRRSMRATGEPDWLADWLGH
jgi:DNA-binding MarR family transcriptional regulator